MSFETPFHILVVESATLPSEAMMAITSNDTISPYSTAVAPIWQLAMPRKNFNMIWSCHVMVTTLAFFHKGVNKNFPAGTKLKKNPTMLIVVAAALLRSDGRILLQKRPEGREMAGLWEFPGGKLEAGEQAEQALVRELAEELDIDVDPEKLTPACFASAAIGSKDLLLLLYTCREWDGEPRAVEGQELGWFTLIEMNNLTMPPADIPLLALLRQILRA